MSFLTLFDCPECGGIYSVEVQVEKMDEDGAPLAYCKLCQQWFRVGVTLDRRHAP